MNYYESIRHLSLRIRIRVRKQTTMNYFAIPGLKFTGENLISRNLSAEYINSAVCDYFKVKDEDMKRKWRVKEIILPRYVAMYLMRLFSGMSFKQIGGFYGGRDHTTAIFAINSVKGWVDVDPVIRNQIEDIKAML